MRKKEQPVKIFISYSHKDESFKNMLVTFLSPLKQQGVIEFWEASRLLLGTEFTDKIIEQINQVDVFLFLVSPDSISSEYINNVELKRAFELHDEGKSMIVPVIIRPCNWKLLKIKKFHAAPIGGKAATLWDNIDEAFQTIADQIAKLVFHVIENRKTKGSTTNNDQGIKTKSKKKEIKKSHTSVFNAPIKAKYVFGEVENLNINNTKKKK